MNNSIFLSADERSVALYCIDSYRDSILNSDSINDQLLASVSLSPRDAKSLIEEIYVSATLSHSQCTKLSRALWSWKAASRERSIAVDTLDRKLQDLAKVPLS